MIILIKLLRKFDIENLHHGENKKNMTVKKSMGLVIMKVNYNLVLYNCMWYQNHRVH